MTNWRITRGRAAWLALLGIAVIALLIGAYFAYERWFPWEQAEIEEWIDGFGVWGPIVYIAVFAASMLFAPLPTAPMPLVAAAVFGPALGFLYTISATAIGSTICFWVARRLGRPALRRLTSQRALDKIDELGERLGIRLLIVLRLFPVAGVDYVSYAAGLTQMRFATYIVISVLASSPILVLAAVLGDAVLERNRELLIGAAVGIVGFFALPVVWVWWRQRRASRGVQPAPTER
ncbi:MAG: TVP38/TMEM64 family protein [Chloroflexi bacterium]|nr:TVP38/TMEM64 family protein [Chloroflexota bacterium]MCY3695840.1 TVP38/TMEM64 family protein [Chloroflexota bacterium]MXX31267.1 TVP38/TMEM64 family protein [Chloroflexota bacterium]MXX80849.1 TVP38/TMEM64 family protein [Chloroflexota bacterium]MYD17462.1 TVP38/TMEM64 family protein [Chloroflexota bacterium]